MVSNPGCIPPLSRADARTMWNVFESSCTLITTTDARSAISITWSCFATIFACTWAAVHPNIPHPRASPWQIWRRHAHLMFWGLIAPELTVLWAIRQWMGARFLVRELKEPNFTRVHGYLAQMGGFMLYKGNDRIGVLQTLEHLKSLLQGQHFAYGPYIIRRADITFQLPTQAQIEDKCKGDGLSKALSILQVWWFAAQCISRWAQGLILTELELVTVSFAIMNGVVYFFWWHKPLKVYIAFPVIWNPPREVHPDIFVVERSTLSNITHVTSSTPEPEVPHGRASTVHKWVNACLAIMTHTLFDDPEDPSMRVGITNTQLSSDYDAYTSLLFASGAGIAFGGIHCLAWNFTFPSLLEQQLWKTSSLVITIVPLLLYIRYARQVLTRARVRQTTGILFYATVTLVAIYILARISLLIEALATLRDLKPGARSQVAWIQLLPHF